MWLIGKLLPVEDVFSVSPHNLRKISFRERRSAITFDNTMVYSPHAILRGVAGASDDAGGERGANDVLFGVALAVRPLRM